MAYNNIYHIIIFIFKESNFKEVWIHGGCAVWSPNIYIRNNRTYGIASVVKSTEEIVINYFCY